jgi:Ca-activated chloride channel family protein
VTLVPIFLALVAAGPAATTETHPARFGVETRLVLLSATAVDKKGRPVRDLRPDELQVFERGKPQKIVHFGHARTTQARLLLIVDASGSMEGDLRESRVRAAIDQILAALDPADEVALAGFDSRYWGVVAFTRDRDAIRRGLKELTPFGSTALHDALDKGAHDVASRGEGRRALLVITDGIDTSSSHQPDDVIAHSRALDVPIYALSLVSPLDDPQSSVFVGGHERPAAVAGSDVLRRYAEMSGGFAFRVSEPRGLGLAARRIVDELKEQYRLGYDPPEGPPGFRSIEVRTTRKGVRVRTRSGYVPPS